MNFAMHISNNGERKTLTSCCLLHFLPSRLVTTPRGIGGKQTVLVRRLRGCHHVSDVDLSPLRYTALWNLVDYPGAVFPTGLVVDTALDPTEAGASPLLSPEDAYNRQLCTSSIACL